MRAQLVRAHTRDWYELVSWSSYRSTYLTDPLSAEGEADKRWRNSAIVNDGIDVDPTDEFVVGSNQLKSSSPDQQRTVIISLQQQRSNKWGHVFKKNPD